jgi:hypothetical protein
MSPDNRPGFLGGVRRDVVVAIDRLRGVERPGGPIEIVLPGSPHFKQYYTPEFFAALPIGDPAVVQFMTEDLIQRVESPVLDVHRTTNEPATDIRGQYRVSVERAETIARDYLRELLSTIRTSEVKAGQTLLVTSIDLLLSSYFGKGDFRAVAFGDQQIPKDGKLKTIEDKLAALSRGDNFKIINGRRSINVTLLPIPEATDHFKHPRFCLIGPKEEGVDKFEQGLEKVRKSNKRVVFEVKRNQLELSTAFLMEYGPDRMVVTEQGTEDYKIWDGKQWTYSDILPDQKRGNLEFMVSIRGGNVDGYIRRERNSLRKEKDKAGVFGIDVVQTGGSLRQNGLVEIRQVLPIPCYPVLLRVS